MRGSKVQEKGWVGDDILWSWSLFLGMQYNTIFYD